MGGEGCSGNWEGRLLEENGRVVNHRNRNESIRPFDRPRIGKLSANRPGLWGFSMARLSLVFCL